MWEAMLRELLSAPTGEMVDEVWAWDAVQHGDAAVVNEENLNGICASSLPSTAAPWVMTVRLVDWLDGARILPILWYIIYQRMWK